MRKYRPIILLTLVLTLVLALVPATAVAAPPAPPSTNVLFFGVSHYQNVVVQIGFPHPQVFVPFLSFSVKAERVRSGGIEKVYYFQRSLSSSLFLVPKTVRLIMYDEGVMIVLSQEYSTRAKNYIFIYALERG